MKKTIRQVADDLGVKSSAVYFKIRNHKSFSEILKPYISKKGNTILISPKGQEILKEAFLNETNPNELSNSAMKTAAEERRKSAEDVAQCDEFFQKILEHSKQGDENYGEEMNANGFTLGTSGSGKSVDNLPELPDFSGFEEQFWQERFEEVENELKKTELMLIELKNEQASLLSKIQVVSDNLLFNNKFNNISRVLEKLEKMEEINKIRTFSLSVAAFCVLFILLYIITLLQ